MEGKKGKEFYYLLKKEEKNMDINSQDLINCIVNWAAQNESRIKSKWPQKGGYEAWVQAELTSFIFEQNNTIRVLREWSIYGNGQRVDLLINSDENEYQDPATLPENSIPIEIKVDSFLNHNEFLTGVSNDVIKLNILRARWPHECIMLVFTFDGNLIDTLTGNGFKPIFRNDDIYICYKSIN